MPKAVNMYFMDNNGLYPCEGEVTKSDLPSSIDLNKLVPKYLDKKPSGLDFYVDDKGVVKIGRARKPNPESDFVFDPETGTILNYIGTSTEVVIPKQIDGVDVIMLGANSFMGKNITYLQTSDPLKIIGSQAFLNCTSLSTVEFLNTEDLYINARAFLNSGITNLILNVSASWIADNAFENCTALETVSIAEGLRGMSNYVFSGCNNLRTVDLPSTLENLGFYAFNNCTKLQRISIPENEIPGSEIRILMNTFYNCTSLESISLPSRCNYIGDYAFYGCTNLKSITVAQPDVISSDGYLGDYAFSGCSSLETVELSGYFSRPGNYAFSDCTLLQNIELPEIPPEWTQSGSMGKGLFKGIDWKAK